MTTSTTAAAAEVMTTSSAEAQTVHAAGRPDHGAAGALLSELFARHGAAVLGLCRVLLRHREEAEDAVQATFLSAYRSLLQGTEPRHPGAWLAAIARNECVGRIRQRMWEPLAERELGSTLPDPVAAAAANADLAQLWRAIGDLPRQQREALLLREFSGLSYIELAEALAVSEPAVESLLFRARRSLRARLRFVHGSIAGVAPLAVIREALARAIGGMPDPSSAGALANVASTPLAAKLAAGTAAIVVAGGTVAVVERDAGIPHQSALPAAKRTQASHAKTPHGRVVAHGASASARARAVSVIAARAPAPARSVSPAAATPSASSDSASPAAGSGSSPPTPASAPASPRPAAGTPSKPEAGSEPGDETAAGRDDNSGPSSAGGGPDSAAPSSNLDEETDGDEGTDEANGGDDAGSGSSGSGSDGIDSSATESGSGDAGSGSGSGDEGSGQDGKGDGGGSGGGGDES